MKNCIDRYDFLSCFPYLMPINFLYRNSQESLKELTAEERKEINQKENTRLGRLVVKSYSPGRERALKIYLDTTPGKSEDNNCID